MNAADLHSTLETLVQRLLAERNTSRHWTGELASSALSTATAVIALSLAEARPDLVSAGLDWLERTQNEDGGWGDTTVSVSNISTTALCWAAFRRVRAFSNSAQRAERWMHRATGSLEPDRIAASIAQRYGNDRTFSVPILTVLAIAGLVPWRTVPQLPFELAACPQKWFRWLRLPVVSYALPALIAIGHVRFRRCRSWNPITGFLRRIASGRTLRVLEQIQPSNGGFLEAVPLTSFVALSLSGAGYHDNHVLRRGIRFLEHAVREDGSWPIDTNLATWTTTLAVNALGEWLPEREREAIVEWLLGQQHRKVHPYTGAPPGAWAWTNLPGGVPDADDTAGALLALRSLREPDERTISAAEHGARWLLDLQNGDGGIPTFCRGWGKLPFDRSGPDLTAHALLAWFAWQQKFGAELQVRIGEAVARAFRYLERTQRPNGSWTPLWFGNQFAENDENPVYGTSRVLLALNRLDSGSPLADKANQWLLRAQNADGGWGGDRGVPSSIEETALAVTAICGRGGSESAIKRATDWLVDRSRAGESTPPSPIGLYFARLWYYERLYPLIFATDALRRVCRSLTERLYDTAEPHSESCTRNAPLSAESRQTSRQAAPGSTQRWS